MANKSKASRVPDSVKILGGVLLFYAAIPFLFWIIEWVVFGFGEIYQFLPHPGA